MRNRLKVNGLQGFQDHEILEWMLYCTIPRGDVNPIAHRLIDEFGSLAGVLEADSEALMSVKGVGETTALFLSNYIGVYKRYLQSKEHKEPRFTTMDSVANYIRNRMIEHEGEYVFALMLDGNFRKIRCEIVSKGNQRSVEVDMRQLTGMCLHSNASFVVLAHNHPSGILHPSYSDEQTTITLFKMLNPLGIRLLDHLIIGKDDYVSMAMSKDHGYMFQQ